MTSAPRPGRFQNSVPFPTRHLRILSAAFALAVLLAAVSTAAEETPAQLLGRLKRCVKRGSAAERKTAVNDIGRLNGHLDRGQSMQASKLLRRALETEESSEIRRLMIRALARFKTTHAWLPVIWASQDDRDPTVKAQARQEVLSGGADYLAVMQKILKEETSESFRGELLLILRDRRKPDAVPMLLAALDDKSRIVQSAAAEALEAISEEAHGYSASRWRAWYEQWRRARPKGGGGPTVGTGGPVEEPAPHVTRSLHPSFYLSLTAKDIVFVVDISGSVGSGGVRKAKQQLAKAVALLASDVKIAALFFSDTAHMWKKGAMVPASPRNKEDLIRFLRGLKPGRKTDVYTSLNAGLKIIQHRIKAKQDAGESFREPVTMVMVSDGQNNMNAVPPRIIVDKLERLDPATSVVHAVVLGTKDSPLMHGIARLGGGHYIRAERP